MTPENFCYFLKGRVELVDGPPSKEEWQQIINHLNLVFNKVTPYIPPVKKEDTGVILDKNKDVPWTDKPYMPMWVSPYVPRTDFYKPTITC